MEAGHPDGVSMERASRSPDALAVSPSCQSHRAKYSTLPKFRFGVCVAHPGSSLRGDLVVVTFASRACGGRGSVRAREGRAGCIALREPKTSYRRAARLGFVSLVSFRLRRQGWKNCGEMAGRAYGKTVWSWPSLLRSSFCGGVCEPNRADSIIQIREAREAKRKVRLPGEHGISRPTIAQGRPSDWLHLYAAVRFFCATSSRSGPRVPAGTRPSLRPLGLEGGMTRQSSGETRHENENSCPLLKDQSHHFPGYVERRSRYAAISGGPAAVLRLRLCLCFAVGFSGAADGELRRAPGPGWV